jgi:hypothetical protein
LFACGECEVLSPLIHIGDSFPQYSLVNEPLIELSNPGASGSLFYLTSDDEFIIKTVQHKEAKFLQRLLPGYYMVSLGGRDGWAERGASWHVDKQHRFFSFFTVLSFKTYLFKNFDNLRKNLILLTLIYIERF